VSEEQEDSFMDCLYERPEPIFSTATPTVVDHEFIMNGRVGIERIVFDTGLQLDIHQSGCDELQQNFFFYIGENVGEEVAISQASDFFYYIGTLDEAYLPLYEWGNLIEKNADAITLDQSYPVYPGFYVTIKQYKKKRNHLLEVVLSQTG
jgi:hypothetical protein